MRDVPHSWSSRPSFRHLFPQRRHGENPGFTLDVGIPLTITVAPGARITSPGRTAITLLGGEVTLRELLITGSAVGVDITGPSTRPSSRANLVRVTVANNTATGVYVHNRATMRMDGCLIQDNAACNGLHKALDSGDVSIENTVIVRNATGVNIESSPFGATVFRNNTLLANTRVGLEYITSTGGSLPTLAGILAFGNGGGQVVLCPAPSDSCLSACSAADPLLDITNDRYRLTAASPASCRDVLDTAPATDRKGVPRPQGAKSDCGADEFSP